MAAKILNIVSGARSGALSVALNLGAYFARQGYEVKTVLRKYNPAGIQPAAVLKDRIVWDYVRALTRLLESEKPEIVMVHGYSTHLWTKIAVARAQRSVKLIHIEHNAERYTAFRAWLLRKLDAYTDCYVCVSQGVAKHLASFGVSPDKIKVIYNGIDVQAFASIQKKPHPLFTVGMTARFSKQKDQMTLIRAVERLIRQNGLPLRLVLMGDGKTRAACEAYVNQNGLGHWVVFESGAFKKLIPHLDAFVLSTHYEGLPLVLCEAMAACIPVIASNIPGVDEIVLNGETGRLVPEGDAAALADVIAEQYACRKEKRYIEPAYERIKEKFSLEQMYKQYGTLVKELSEQELNR